MPITHAHIRAQQRGIPPLIDQMLNLFGHKQYDGHGGVVVYFNKRSIQNLERQLGKVLSRQVSEWRDTYKVVATGDGETITIGHRYKRVRRT